MDGDANFLNGQIGKDVITITSIGTNATVRGGSEDDTITNNEEAVAGISLYGDKGADTITDEGGAVSIFGGGGKDTIDANDGLDTINGGAAADRFVFAAGDAGHVANTNDGDDTPLLPSSPQQPTLSSSIPLATTVLLTASTS